MHTYILYIYAYIYIYTVYAYNPQIQTFARMKVRCGMSRRWAKHVARVREGRDVYSVLVGKLEEKDLSADGRKILKMDL
jgi:hypothetical protein